MLELTLDEATGSRRRSSLLDQIGNTPLLRLRAVAPDLPESVEIWAKAEWFNPGGSVKDRAALRMIQEAEASMPDVIVSGQTEYYTIEAEWR